MIRPPWPYGAGYAKHRIEKSAAAGTATGTILQFKAGQVKKEISYLS
jgi:hypothetical protein